MSDESEFLFEVSSIPAAESALVALSSALHIATEFAIFPEKLSGSTPVERLNALMREITKHAKGISNDTAGIQDEAAGLSLALALIEDNNKVIRKTHGF